MISSLQVVEVELDLVEEEPTDLSPVNCSCLMRYRGVLCLATLVGVEEDIVNERDAATTTAGRRWGRCRRRRGEALDSPEHSPMGGGRG
jgi:hypothetical protein